MKFIKLNERHINIEQIVSIRKELGFYCVRMSNADEYMIEANKNGKKIIDNLLGNK